METHGNTFDKSRTENDSSANIAASADHPLSTFPAEDDWAGWVEIWCRGDTGTIDCVPECLRPAIMQWIGPDGRLNEPDMIPSTPYSVARFMHHGCRSRPQPPWTGSGLQPHIIRQMWEAHLAGEDVVAAAAEVVVEEDEQPGPDLYVIQSGGGPIKIGISVDPVRRMKGLQTAHPFKLELLCIVPGGYELEAEYHRQFAAYRLEGEWFSPAPEILAEIDRLIASPLSMGAGR